MERNIKRNANYLCIAVFIFCLLIRFVEYFLIQTDKTAIGENVLHKAVGVIVLALALKRANLSWSGIGFQRSGFVSGILKGLLLGSVCFAVSYGIELVILTLQGNPAHFELYISSFSLTGSQAKNTGFLFFALWVGLGDHLFNNTVATNMLHVVSSTGADELQIVRIMAAQLVSFIFVLVIYIYRSRKEGE